MKAIFPFLAVIIIGGHAMGQGVGIGTNSPQSSALLDVSSTTKGVLFPRMTTAQRNAIPSPAKGLVVYDTNDGLYQYNGSAWVLVGNSNGGGIMLPYANSSASSGTLFSVGNTGNGGGILGRSLAAQTIGVRGVTAANGGYGLTGINNGPLGYGVSGVAIDNSAIYAVNVGEGVALRGNSPTGYALVANGEIMFGGNNMGAAPGKVLTSIDANGNARWEFSDLEQIAFRVDDATFTFNNFSHGITHKVHFLNQLYDLGNDIETTPFEAILTPTMSTFVVPVTGIYAFNFNLTLASFVANADAYWDYIGAYIMLDRSGSVSTLHTSEQSFDPTQNQGFNLRGGCQKRLLAGDKIYLTLRQTNTASANSTLRTLDGQTWFAGSLVRAE